MKLALHIGASGSRGLHRWLARHRDTLMRAGVHHPAIFGPGDRFDLVTYALRLLVASEERDPRNKFADVAEQEAYRDAVKLALDHEVRASREAGARAWVISDEALWPEISSPALTERLRNLFIRHFDEIAVYVHLRPQVELIPAEAARLAEAGRVVTQAALAGPDFGLQLKHLDYDDAVARWERFFGAEAVRLVPFRRQASMAEHLCAELGLDIGALEEDRPDERGRPGWRAIALANAVNRVSAGRVRLDLDAVAAAEPLSLAPDLAAHLQVRFEAGNQRLAARRADIMPEDLRLDASADVGAPTAPLAEAPCLFAEQLSDLLLRMEQGLVLERYCRLLAEFRLAVAERRLEAAAAIRDEISRLSPSLGGGDDALASPMRLSAEESLALAGRAGAVGAGATVFASGRAASPDAAE